MAVAGGEGDEAYVAGTTGAISIMERGTTSLGRTRGGERVLGASRKEDGSGRFTQMRTNSTKK